MNKFTSGPWTKHGSVIRSICDNERKVADVQVRDDEGQANAKLIAASPDLLVALQWALPLAKIAMEAHRMDRLRCGHNDITGTYTGGDTWVGIYQSEIDEIEFAQSVIAKALA